MKRIYLLAICAVAFLGSQFLLNCSSPLESDGGIDPNPPPPPETVYINDTVFLFDSNCDSFPDTIFDTTFIVDTLYDSTSDTVFDTTFIIDTVHDSTVDTIVVIDTTVDTFFDTIVVIDTIVDSTTDTIFVIDTVIQTDTVIDSFIDTVILIDTVSDTIIDTLIIIEPDTSGMVLCSQISACNKEIVWVFSNAEGIFHLEFVAEPSDAFVKRTLIVEIEGDKYMWKPEINRELTIDRHLPANATINIYPDKPLAFGHSVDVCLTMTRQ